MQAAHVILRVLRQQLKKKQFLRNLSQMAKQSRRRTRAAIILQSIARTYFYRKRYLLLLDAARTIQVAIRRYLSQLRNKQQIRNVIRLQSYVRMRMCRRAFLGLRTAATLIQKWYRTQRQYHREAARLLVMRNAALLIQKYWRR